jgi:hypothetical protein
MDVVASGACVDGWLQDQLVVFMALAQVMDEGEMQCVRCFSEAGWHGSAGRGGVVMKQTACMVWP